MRGTSNSETAAARSSFGRRLWADASGWRRLLMAAAFMHVVLALGLHYAGRAQVAPGLIDGDGIMGSFAFDSYEYQKGAVRLAGVLQEEGVRAWAGEPQPLHVRPLSVLFALLGPLTGHGTLSAEPFNLLCYLAVVGLTLLLGREVGGPRVGLYAAGAVALWPTLLLHTLQLLKDPLFIAGALALVLCVTTWLTRTYGLREAAGAVALMGSTTLLLLLVRPSFVAVIFALVLVGAALLAVRQIAEGRLLYWNMVAPCVMLAAGALLLPLLLFKAPVGQRFKQYPSDGGGAQKTAVSAGERVATIVTYLPRAAVGEDGTTSRVGRLVAAADKAAHRVGTVRYRFSASYTEAGSGVDRGVRFDDLKSLVMYLPRAFAIGFWAPFPDTWVGAGRRVGSVGKLLSGAETLVMYVVQLLALVAVLRPPRRLASWLLLAVTAFGVTGLGLVVPNVGALYRFRYTFWVLLLVLGAKGLESLIASRRRLLRPRGRAAACVALALALAAASACAPNAGGERATARETAAATTNAAAADGRAGRLGFTLVNITGADLRAVYVSPSGSAGWEENVVGEGGLADGDSVELRFSPEEKTAAWDLRIEGADEHFAEWKGLRLGGVSSVTLYLDVVGERVVVAEVE